MKIEDVQSGSEWWCISPSVETSSYDMEDNKPVEPWLGVAYPEHRSHGTVIMLIRKSAIDAGKTPDNVDMNAYASIHNPISLFCTYEEAALVYCTAMASWIAQKSLEIHEAAVAVSNIQAKLRSSSYYAVTP